MVFRNSADVFSASIPCTCGELFQGSLHGEPCLVSCPIDRYSTVYLSGEKNKSSKLGRKTREALARLTDNALIPAAISMKNRLPRGRGYGTSTADIGAALYAAGAAEGKQMTAEEASRIAVSVEPSDSSIFPGLTLFAHTTGNFSKHLGIAPPAKILIIDPGGSVDTECFNSRDWQSRLRDLAVEHQSAYKLLEAGISAGNLEEIGQAASQSAHLHQSILFNPLLDDAMMIAEHIHAFGVCRAHSGTILGLLLEPEQDEENQIIAFCRSCLPARVKLFFAKFVDGGVRLRSFSKAKAEIFS